MKIESSRQRIWIQAVIALALVFQTHLTLAENRLSLRKTSVSTIAVELSNTDGIAGFQFSINARGGIVLGSYEASERMNVAGMTVFQYAKDASTLNVVILAPVRSSLPSGQGTIGAIALSFNGTATADSARVFLSGVIICNTEAQSLDVTTNDLIWNVKQTAITQAGDFVLEQNYPNPFNPSTTITYRLLRSANVSLAVYDITGRQINLMVSQYQSEGQYSVKWNAEDGQGSKLASGMYVARLQVGDQVAIRKMIVTK